MAKLSIGRAWEDSLAFLSRDRRLRLPEGYAVVAPEPANLATLIRELS